MLDAFEMWLWRRVLRISWSERRTNEWVRDQVGQEERCLFKEVKKRKIRKYRHWKRRGDSMVLATIEGETEARCRRGRRRREWVDNIITWEEGIENARRNAWERMSTAHTGL